MDRMEIAFHLSIALTVAMAIGLAGYGLMVITLAFAKVMGA